MHANPVMSTLIKHVHSVILCQTFSFLTAFKCVTGNAQPGTEIFNLPAVTSSSK